MSYNSWNCVTVEKIVLHRGILEREKEQHFSNCVKVNHLKDRKMSPEMVIYFLLLLIELICQTAASANRLSDIYWNSTNPM